MEERWGHTKPVPEERITLVGQDDAVHGFDVAYTPGHASHHVSYRHVDSGWVFAGDVAGVRVAEAAHTLMPTPPPDINLEHWHESLDKLETWSPKGIDVAHFGGHEDVERVLEDARRELDEWAQKAKEIADQDAFTEAFEADLHTNVPDDAIRESMRQASEPRLEYPGLERYWRKRDGG
jgi:glyoxylase-like metal-dependent hydrolase (beta-lactamase superfamily II)